VAFLSSRVDTAVAAAGDAVVDLVYVFVVVVVVVT